MVNAPNAAKKSLLHRKKLKFNLPAIKAEDVNAFLGPTEAHLQRMLIF